jgi:hypothetical protein
MEWMIAVVLFGLVVFEFNRVATHINGLKADKNRLSDEIKELRERVERLEGWRDRSGR